MILLQTDERTIRDMCEVLIELSDQPADHHYGLIAASVLQQLDLARASQWKGPSVDECDYPYGETRPLPVSFYEPQFTSGALYTRPGTDQEMYIGEFANEGVDYHSSISPTNPSIASRAIEAMNGYWPALKLLMEAYETFGPGGEEAHANVIKKIHEFLTPREGPKIVRV